MKLVKNSIFVLVLFFGFFLVAKSANATTYYLDPDCARVTTYNEATQECTGGSSRSFPSFSDLRSYFRTNAVGATDIIPGDIIDGLNNIFVNDGVWYIGTDFITSSAEQPIIFRNVNRTGSNSITIYSHQNLIFDNINFQGAGGLTTLGAVISNVKVQNCNFSGGSSFGFANTSGITIDNVTVDSSTGVSINIINTSSNVNISDVTVSNSLANNFPSISLQNAGNITLENVQVTGSGEKGISIYGKTSGTISLTDVYAGITRERVSDGNEQAGINISSCNNVLLQASEIYSSYNVNSGSNGTDRGILIVDSSFQEGSYLKNFNISNNGDDGIFIDDSSNIYIQDGIANVNDVGLQVYGALSSGIVIDNVEMNHNRGDGFNCADTEGRRDSFPEMIIKYSEASYNGPAILGEVIGSGDGYSSHEDCNVKMYYSIGIGNSLTGVANVEASCGSIYNSLFVDNGIEGTPRANIYLTAEYEEGISSQGYIFYNNIGVGNDHDALFEDRGGSRHTVDYNLYNPTNEESFYSNGNIFSNWLSYHTTNNKEPNSQNADPLFTDPDNDDFTLAYLSPAIDAGTHIDGITQNCSGACTDYTGVNSIYGLPDIGAYEYQPPYEMGNDKVSTSSPIRMYGDEKFRNKEAPDAEDITADLDITIPDSDKSEWLDIEITSWGDTKTWTESTTESITNTAHTIGDLQANKYYNVSVDDELGLNITGDDCNEGICASDNNGQIIFTYTGTYSEHTFQVEEGDNSAPTISNGEPNGSSSNTTQTLEVTTNETATCKYSTTANTSYAEMTDTFTNTNSTTHNQELTNLTLGTHAYYVRCQDELENTNETDYQISFTIIEPSSEEDLEIDDVEYKVTENSLTVKWETNNDADSKIEYGLNKDLKEEKKDSDREKDHKITIKNLTPDTIYYFRVKSEDEEGSTDRSKIYEVRTQKAKPGFFSNFFSSNNSESNSLIQPREYQSFEQNPNNQDNPNPIQKLEKEKEETKQGIKTFFSNFFQSIINFFKGLFGK